MTGTSSDRHEETVSRIGVVGSGVMGMGIAQVCAAAGLDVVVTVSSDASLESGPGRLTAVLDRAVAKGKISEEARQTTLDRVRFTRDLGELADRQLVIEAVTENEAVKRELFTTLDKIVRSPEALLASNTSSIPIVRLARATERPDHVVGIHFFNPAPVLPLVEIIPSVLTADPVARRATRFVTDVLGKQPVNAPDRAGFIVNALLFPYLLSAIRMLDAGLATAEVIDQSMVQGCSHPLGPLRLADLIGLDTTVSIAEAMYEEFKEPLYAPPALLLRMVEGGLLGRKSGQGFYAYA
ncbi:3-hydroxybutyryl-CoA dehydrogenase [Streptomyces sp. NPDC056161]|uniref:3-hydroxybutyryl-CoA dehydrogenase n=1 Tax=Streptomyces sp. NPDC056161 TaxID=3345732 RepID=UPI0035E03878